MPHNRFYIDHEFTKNSSISLTGDEHHHIKVMRAKKEDLVELVNGKGSLATAEILEIKKNETLLSIKSVILKKEDENKLVLVQSLIKPHRLEFVLEKSVELGISEFWIFSADYSEKQNISENKLNRMNLILISAMKQCGALYLPSIKFFDSLEEVSLNSTNCYFGDVDETAPKFIDVFQKSKKETYLIVGPERGFSEKELDYLKSSLKAKNVKLNNNILRSETAAIAFATIAAQLQIT